MASLIVLRLHCLVPAKVNWRPPTRWPQIGLTHGVRWPVLRGPSVTTTTTHDPSRLHARLYPAKEAFSARPTLRTHQPYHNSPRPATQHSLDVPRSPSPNLVQQTLSHRPSIVTGARLCSPPIMGNTTSQVLDNIVQGSNCET